MPTIMPIRDLRNTSEISEIAHKLSCMNVSLKSIESIKQSMRLKLRLQKALLLFL